jgi:chorismate-pyruvate lyase
MPSRPQPVTPDLETLARLFYDTLGSLGDFTEVSVEELPDAYRLLLAHDAHMTVTVEQFHNSPVRVRVLDKRVTQTHYARKILLERQSDGAVVQFGIMRVNFACLTAEVREEIASEAAPLGRILIQHDVLRKVQLFSLWRVTMGAELTRRFGLERPGVTYGRTALIELNGVPAVELIEIIAPVDESGSGETR